MALNQFIASVRSEVAKRYDLKTDAEIDAFFIGMEESAKDNQQSLEKRDKMLRDTVAELCEARRLLKEAVYDIQYLCNNYAVEVNKEIKSYFLPHYRCDRCDICKYDADCKRKGKETECCYDWRFYNEAMKLIGETNDEP